LEHLEEQYQLIHRIGKLENNLIYSSIIMYSLRIWLISVEMQSI
jgi:hypothetical protein